MKGKRPIPGAFLYCKQCRAVGKLLYQSTQFNKYYADYVHKTKATMHLHLNHKPGKTMQVDRARDTMEIVDTDTGELMQSVIATIAIAKPAESNTAVYLSGSLRSFCVSARFDCSCSALSSRSCARTDALLAFF